MIHHPKKDLGLQNTHQRGSDYKGRPRAPYSYVIAYESACGRGRWRLDHYYPQLGARVVLRRRTGISSLAAVAVHDARPAMSLGDKRPQPRLSRE
jgi:hypothetical protein